MVATATTSNGDSTAACALLTDDVCAGGYASRATLQVAHLHLLAVELNVLQLHMLIHASFGAVGLVAAFDWALVVSLNLRGCSPVSFALVIAKVPTVLIVLMVIKHWRHSSVVSHWHYAVYCFELSTYITGHLWDAVCMDALPNKVHLIHVLLAYGFDCLTAKNCLLKCTIRTTAATCSTTGLSTSGLFQHLHLLIKRICWCFILIFYSIHQFLPLFN